MTDNVHSEQQNTRSVQALMERSLRQIRILSHKQIPINLKELDSYKVCFLTIMEIQLEINKKKKRQQKISNLEISTVVNNSWGKEKYQKIQKVHRTHQNKN